MVTIAKLTLSIPYLLTLRFPEVKAPEPEIAGGVSNVTDAAAQSAIRKL